LSHQTFSVFFFFEWQKLLLKHLKPRYKTPQSKARETQEQGPHTRQNKLEKTKQNLQTATKNTPSTAKNRSRRPTNAAAEEKWIQASLLETNSRVPRPLVVEAWGNF
jgi:hypothetical protein